MLPAIQSEKKTDTANPLIVSVVELSQPNRVQTDLRPSPPFSSRDSAALYPLLARLDASNDLILHDQGRHCSRDRDSPR